MDCRSKNRAGAGRPVRWAAILLAMMLGTAPAFAQGTLRIGMTAADIPLTTGQTDQGGEGMRFMGYTVYDGLINWDLSSADKPSVLVSGLASSWKIDDTDKTRWIFTLRQGVKFHDGSDFKADAVVWNLDKLLNDKSPQYDPKQAAQGRSRIPSVKGYKVLDDYTVEIRTGTPDAFLPYQIGWVMMSSPAQWEKVGRDWNKFAMTPSGTGPWKLASFVPHTSAELVPNKDYWDKNRVPKLDRLVLLPIPEAATRTAALRSGQVDWIEAPSPDAVPSLEKAGFKIVTNAYPHNWTWHLSVIDGSPWKDVRVRKAANLAIDRNGLKVLLNGLMIPAKGFVTPGSQWFGHPQFDVKYDPEAAKKLLAEAGYGPSNPVKVRILISASGSGQMQPLPMNEYIQQNLAEVGIKVDFDVVEWNTMINLWRAGAKSDQVKGANGINFSYFIQDPFTAFIRHIDSTLVAPNGTNWGYYQDPAMDALIEKARTTFDAAEQDKVLQQIHEKIVDEALFLFVTHDVNPRAMSTKVTGFVQAQNWFQDFSPITMK
ncbi:ABC-type transport system, substrate-binding protein [Enhydrobacter aerosaccus]|uniref:ABC-type transport system, substrate-binding protein n=2 Tax=Enhydrobacter aerosaccus TaxID=225324 RepID=A0A1T4KYJ7_9HYPH|nr:ABC-type transport system, substrate-binding protein [Enhydrobacter aerosaccus]